MAKHSETKTYNTCAMICCALLLHKEKYGRFKIIKTFNSCEWKMSKLLHNSKGRE